MVPRRRRANPIRNKSFLLLLYQKEDFSFF